jgi:hypothetical protein
MINKTKQSAVTWFANKAYQLFEQYSEGVFDRITLNKLMLAAAKEAEEMEKMQILDAWDNGWHEHINPPEVITTSMDYYKETYGGNK